MAETHHPAGQPFTFSGIARYASARMPRLLGAALIFVLIPGAIIGHLAQHCWSPVITEAVAALPESAYVANGTLQAPVLDSRLLAANQFLSVQLSLGDNASERAPADLAVDIGRFEITASSLFGELAIPYRETFSFPLNRSVFVPFWGAWRGPLILGFCVTSIVMLITTWFVLALLYAPLAFLIGSLAHKDLSFSRAWKLSVAAQWPGSLLMSFALALYSTGQIGLLFVIIMLFAHFIPTLLNVLIAPLFVSKADDKVEEEELPEKEKPARRRVLKKTGQPQNKKNPFTPSKGKIKGSKNPFRAGKADEDD